MFSSIVDLSVTQPSGHVSLVYYAVSIEARRTWEVWGWRWSWPCTWYWWGGGYLKYFLQTSSISELTQVHQPSILVVFGYLLCGSQLSRIEQWNLLLPIVRKEMWHCKEESWRMETQSLHVVTIKTVTVNKLKSSSPSGLYFQLFSL